MASLHDYISKLMTNDQALHDFLVDPIKAGEQEHGLSKAERSVLRRTVHHLSNGSKNGYSLARDLGSYRRSLRLLQNVLHTAAGKELSDQSQNSDQHYVYIFYNGRPGNYSGATNQQANYPYSHYFIAYGNGSTIGEVMNDATILSTGERLSEYFTNQELPDPVSGGTSPYINSFTVPGGFPGSGQYTANFVSEGSTSPILPDYVFWFYSVNGRPVPAQHNFGKEGTSYINYQLGSNEVIYWQLIAPDHQYGFQPCPNPKYHGVTAD